MGKKKDRSHKTFKPRGPLIPPNKRHKSVKDYDRKKEKSVGEEWVDNKHPELFGQEWLGQLWIEDKWVDKSEETEKEKCDEWSD